MKQRYLQSGWVFCSEAPSLAGAYEIHHKTITIFPTLGFSVLLQRESREAEGNGTDLDGTRSQHIALGKPHADGLVLI